MGKEKTPTLVIIDDEEGFRETLSDIFSEVPYFVNSFGEGKRAIAAMELSPPQIVITDMFLPDLSGIEILKATKEINPDAAVILITGHASLESAVAAMNQGANAYILKPVNIEELKIIVRKALREIKLSEQNKKLIDQLQLSNRHLETVNQKLSVLNQDIESLLHVVSHDLKGPLINIQGFSSRLEKHYEYVLNALTGLVQDPSREKVLAVAASLKERLEEDALEDLGFIQKGVKRMEVLITHLLALSRAGRKSTQKEPVDMGELVDELAGIFGYQFQENKIQFSREPLPVIHCNRAEISQVFSNLISNAIHYMGDKPLKAIQVGCKEFREFFKLAVKDTGIGIEERDIPEIFKPFVRLNEIQIKGEGIGLAIVRKIIIAHGGSIWVESKKDMGSAFYFTLPKTKDEGALEKQKN